MMSGGVCWLDRVKIGFGVRTEVLLWMHLSTGRASSTKNVQNIPKSLKTPKMMMTTMMMMMMIIIIIISKLSVVVMVVVKFRYDKTFKRKNK